VTRQLLAQAAVFAAGAVVGLVFDRIHVVTGVLWYAHPVLFGQAVWVPFLFGFGGLVLVNGHRLFLRHPPPLRPSPFSLVAPAVGFAAAYLATGLWSDHPVWLTAGLVLFWLGRVAGRPTADRIAAGLAFAVGGPLVEAVVSATGGFFYRHPDLFGVPIWLPALYLHVSLFTRQIDLLIRSGDVAVA
jgi:hypothetical protein